MLESDGFEVSTSDNALRIVRQVAEWAPDLVLIAHTLPGFRGGQAIRLLSEMMRGGRLRRAAIALMDVDAPADVLDEARAQGAVAYIDKGISPDEMARAVVAIVGQSLRASA